jgi:hypothetical protein
MEKMAEVLQNLGDGAITAFIVWQILDTIEVLVMVGLVAWGIRTVWAKVKNNV